MGTRSVCGVRIGGEDKFSYNQYDGYPTGVGDGIAEELGTFFQEVGGYDEGLGLLKQQARSLRMVKGREGEPPPSPDMQRRFLADGSANLRVSRESPEDWYCLLRGHQGSIVKRLQAGVALDAEDFIQDSLFCEWGYVLNLDSEELEVYVGFQTKRPKRSRYAKGFRPKRTEGEREVFYPCELLAVVPLRALADGSVRKVSTVPEVEAYKAAQEAA
jgi:hypothetical protein